MNKQDLLKLIEETSEKKMKEDSLLFTTEILSFSIVKAIQNSPDRSGMAFFCLSGLSRFCGLSGCHFDSAQ